MSRNRRHSSESPYSARAAELAKRYESVSFEQVHGPWMASLPPRPGLALDVGAGSGRDAAWPAGRGWEVVAVEPAEGMRNEARRRHPSSRIRWIDDALPALDETRRLDHRFDLILVSAVWMHLPPGRQRERAFRKLAELLRPGGLLVFTLRLGEPDVSRGMHPADGAELAALGRKVALQRVALPRVESEDMLGRAEITWSVHVFRLPDDGTGALPLLRHIIINDRKSATYKLALLRVLVRIADGSRGMVLHQDDEYVTVPFGLVALYWMKAFKPLVGAGLAPARLSVEKRKRVYPQSTDLNKGLGFVGEGFRALVPRSPHDFRIGERFKGPDASHLVRALRDICGNIRKMPAHYITLPGSSEPVFRAKTATVRTGRRSAVSIDRELLSAFGTFKVPAHVWDAMSRYACWIEPAIVNEWSDLMRSIDERRGVRRPLDDYVRALTWLEAERDTGRIRDRVRELIAKGQRLYCTWTGRRLGEVFEIDHCFPFACWPNNDLWNLLPASRWANQKKGRQLPSAELLHGSRERVLEWWREGYEAWGVLERFRAEAFSSLPLSALVAGGVAEEGESALWESVFAGVDNQRVRLRADQQLEEWAG